MPKNIMDVNTYENRSVTCNTCNIIIKKVNHMNEYNAYELML